MQSGRLMQDGQRTLQVERRQLHKRSQVVLNRAHTGRAGTQCVGTSHQGLGIEASHQQLQHNWKRSHIIRRYKAATSSRYRTTAANDAARAANQKASLGPLVNARSSCVDTSVQNSNSKYRSEARELLNKWTSRERNGAEHSYLSKPTDNLTANGQSNKANDYPYRNMVSSYIASRSAVPTSSRFSSHSRSLLSPSPVPLSHTPRAERPWRQRLAESSRIRASLGDDGSASYSAIRNSYARSRRSSLSQTSGDELSESVGRLRSYVNNSGNRSREGSTYGSRTFGSTSYCLHTPSYSQYYGRTNAVSTPPTEFMTRSCSPVARSRNEILKTLTSSDVPSLLDFRTPDVLIDSQKPLRVEKSHERSTGESMVSKSPSTRENSCIRDGNRSRKKTSKERTARRSSRQVGLTPSSSSSDEAFDRSLTRADMRRRRRRRKESAKSVALSSTGASDTGMLNIVDKSLTEERTAADTKRSDESTYRVIPIEIISTGSPPVSMNEQKENSTLSHKSRRTNGEKSPDRSQVSDQQSASVSNLVMNISKTNDGKMNETGKLEKRHSAMKIDQTTVAKTKSYHSGSVDDLIESAEETDASSILDDESHYSAIVHFKPNKASTKRGARVPPVPGLWKVADADEFISKNKHLSRSPYQEATAEVWTIRPNETVNKKVVLPKHIVKGVLPAKNEIKKNDKKESNETVEDQDLNKKVSKIKRLLAMNSKPIEQKNEEKTKDVHEKKKDTEKAELAASKIKDEVGQVNKSQLKELKAVTRAEQKTPQLKGVKTKAKQEEVKEESIQTLVSLVTKGVQSQEAVTTRALPVRLSITHPQKIREKKPLVTTSTSHTLSKKPDKLTVTKTLMEKRLSIVHSQKIREKKPLVTTSTSHTLSKKPAKLTAAKTLMEKRLSITHSQKIREKKPLVTTSTSHTLSKKPAKLTAAKTLMEKRKSTSSTSYSCREYSKKRTACNCELMRKSQQHKAQVTVDTPIPGVNTCRVRLRVKRAKKILPICDDSVVTAKKSLSVESEPTNVIPLSLPSETTASSSSQHLADVVALDIVKGDRKSHRPSPIIRFPSEEEEYNKAGRLVLPDKSLLEEYVNRKHGRLEGEEASFIGNELRCSPESSINSEILPACAVRVFERSPYGVPVITTPSRSVSRLSSGCSTEPATTSTVMLDTLTSYNNYNSTPQGFLRDSTTRIQIAKPISFDAPKSPFEERVQQQANAIRKASATAANNELLLQDRHHSPRRGSAQLTVTLNL
ncbi:hypothetical protein KIN20_006212 [Parelaphostrongylus tenuis]|uniref:Uncharacterized protein n=1 Tax=Parelaphostrongylus tenuis TaxID=148309 RepID=A0AAD5QI47_PARTN|nr:hypothetical protein KIN20_006212 [Parelaphostrongylus tenuis]